MDPTPWNLLHDGVIVSVHRDGAGAAVEVACSHLRPEAFLIRLSRVATMAYTLFDAAMDEPEITDPFSIAAAEPNLVDAEVDGDALVVWGTRGTLRLRYEALSVDGLSLDALRDLARQYWDGWRAHNDGAHPLVADALAGHADPDALLSAWRTSRTSELADAVTVLDEIHRGPPPVPIASVNDVDAWIDRWSESPGASLAELARCAVATWDVLLDPGLDTRASRALCERWWEAIARAVAALHEAAPDPRLGRGVEAVLRGPYDHWFRVDEVAHAVGSCEVVSAAPSFADHALALLERHADAGTAARLESIAERLLIEADCNGAEASRRLRLLARRLRERFPTDRALSSQAAAALRVLAA
ncbi:MAG: hypothetical protein R3A52_32805 [Polyangiales bacterium]